MKILITGGHISPALAVIDRLQEKKTDNQQIFFVGKKYNYTKERSLSLEYKEIEKRRIPFYDLVTGRFSRIFSFQFIVELIKIPFAIAYSLQLVSSIKPDVLLTFGSYIAVPVAIACFFLRVPIITHEQAVHPGLANRIIAIFAKKIFVSFEETLHFFPPNKTQVSGLPLKKTVFETLQVPFKIEKKYPVLYITGGSLGSHSINMLIESILPELLKKYIVIHQTGNIQEYHDLERLEKVKNLFDDKLKNNYYLRDHFFETELGYIYHSADLVISRAGANTFFELVRLHKPAILIPLPWSAAQEQQKHATLFQNQKLGEIFSQNGNPHDLLHLIERMLLEIKTYQQAFTNLPHNQEQNATETIVNAIQASV